MKGILYEGFLLNRKWFFVAGIAAVLNTLACVILIANGMAVIANSIFSAGEILVVTLVDEWLDRHFENNLKCRFTDVKLAAGITKNMFVMSELLKNLITMAVGLTMCAAMNGIVFAAEKVIGLEVPFWNIFYIKFAVLLVLIEGLIDFISLPLVIDLKSAEKAGLVIGIVIGFGIVMPITIINNLLDSEPNKHNTFLEMIYGFFDNPYFFLAVFGIAAVIYAVAYAVLLRRVKKGDVC